MDYLFARLSNIMEQVHNKYILLLLDYDGTLTPIAANPEKAVISKEIKKLLQNLSKRPYCELGIISGRSLEDIRNIVSINDIIYAGNHGLEIEGPNIKFKSQVLPQLKSIIHTIAEELLKSLSIIKGVLVEDKGLTLSIHYRLVAPEDIPAFERIFSEVTTPYTINSKIKIHSGKKVYEIKPPVQWDKGKAVLWLMARQQFTSEENKILTVYIGDDVTDEDAFNVLKGKGLTIFVGESGTSAADYYLNNVEEVAKFLYLMLEQKVT